MSSISRHDAVRYSVLAPVTPTRWAQLLAGAPRYFSVWLVPVAVAIWLVDLYLLLTAVTRATG